MLAPHDAAAIAEKLTEKQKQALMAIRPGEERRAVDFSGSVARGLQSYRSNRPALLAVVITGRGTVAWYRHTTAGLLVRASLAQSKGEE